jgi:Subtilase family
MGGLLSPAPASALARKDAAMFALTPSRRLLFAIRRSALVVPALLAACNEQAEDVEGDLPFFREGSPDADDTVLDEVNGLELVHESIRHVAPDGSSVLISSLGEVTAEIEQATARPWTHMSEPYVYNDEGWTAVLDNGDLEVGFRIWRRPNTEPYEPEPSSGPPIVSDSVTEAVSSAGDGLVFLNIQMRNFPEWDLPVRPSPHTVPIADYFELLEQRNTMLQQRAALLEDISHSLRALISGAGGTIEGMSASGGWVSAALPAHAVELLLTREDIATITRADAGVELLVGAPTWRQGDSRSSKRNDAMSFISQGYDGARPNPHNIWGRISIAVIEQFAFEDDACAFMDTASCTGTRIGGEFACDDADGDGTYCETIGNWDDENEAGNINHGTKTAAAALGDYSDDQGNGRDLHDPNYSGGIHTDDWEAAASGMAPEAFLFYFGKWKPMFESASVAAALDVVGIYGFDVANLSLELNGGNPCDAEVIDIAEAAAENAFDDGILVVVGAGNNNGPSSACNVGSPADLTKTLAVNAFDACRVSGANCTSACQNSPYLWCLVDQATSARGGDSVSLAGGGLGNLSLIDLVAANRFYYQTDERGLEGWVIDGSNTTEATADGTSIAAPIVAGLAAIVKDFFIAKGAAWVNYPGAMQTVMLAMGDRHYSTNPTNTTVSTVQRTTGASDLYGVGRAKVRLLEQAGTGPLGQVRTTMREVTFSSGSADSSFLAWNVPLPPGTQMVKCVMLQMEDTSETGAHSFSNIDLSVRIRAPTGTFCTPQDSLLATTTDSSKDVKSMVTYASATLPGKCVDVLIDKIGVPQAGITTRTFCYAASQLDDAPR